MRARLLRPALVAALTGSVALALAAGAAGKPLLVEDPTGDANGVNDQGVDQGLAGTTTPVSAASADLVRATLANTWAGRRCTGFTLTMELAGDVDPSAPLIYRLMGETPKNDGVFQIFLDNSPVAGGATVLRYADEQPGDFPFVQGEDNSMPLATPAKVDGRTITFTVLAKEIAAIGDKPGNKISDIRLDVRGSSGKSFAPLVDQAGTDKSFVMCG